MYVGCECSLLFLSSTRMHHLQQQQWLAVIAGSAQQFNSLLWAC